jgi:hypothetical protein
MALDPSIRYGSLDLTSPPYLWEFGADLGKPEQVITALQQQLQDGEVVSVERVSNRSIVISILVEATDLSAQADAEAALAAECAKVRNTLTYDPGDGSAAVTVFDTFEADMAFDRDDDMEQAGYRRWNLTIPALPFARSANLVTVSVAAAPSTVTETVVDSGSSATGWAVAPTAGNAVQTLSSSTTWTAPTGVTSVTVEAEGAGGGGSGLNVDGTTGGGGGGGGAYASSVVAVTPGTGYAVAIGAGGTKGNTLTNSNAGGAGGATTFASTTVKAAGGSGAPAHTTSNGAGGAGGTVANSIGTTRTAGSAGGAASYTGGGAGIAGGTGGNAAAPLGSASVGKGGTGDGDATNAQAGFPGSMRLTYDGVWTVASASGAVQASKVPYGNTASYLERTGLSQSLATLPYIKAVTSWTGSGSVTSVLVNGNPATILAQSGGTYYIDGTGLGTLNSVRFVLSSPGTAAAVFSVDSVSVTNTYTGGSTGRSNSRQVQVLGSARAVGSLSVEDSAAALGSTLVYSSSATSSVQPNLRQYLVAGPTVTADSTTVSGSTSDLGTQHWFDLPASGVAQAGYLLLARVKHASAGARTITWSGRSRMGGADVGDVQTDSRTVTLAAATWTIVPVALLNLPVTRVGTGGLVRIGLLGPAGLTLDEAWLMDLDNGRLTWVECGTSRRLWLDTASVNDPVPSMWRGVAADRSDALHAGVDASAWGVHELVPPLINVYTVTSGSTAAVLSLSYYPAHLFHATV